VGHDPDFSRLVQALTGAQVEMAKGGIARIDYPRGVLDWLLRPRALRLIAKAT
jgi:phosphohistidine phosphatase SixA